MQKIIKLFQMSDSVWEKHANPWSVWTRYPCLPALIAAYWFSETLGLWSWVIAVLTVIWIWLNPRVFPRPGTTHHWASKAVLGERVWLNHKQIPIPSHHTRAIRWLNAIMTLASAMIVIGMLLDQASWLLFGTIAVLLGKSWFLDRMVWLFEDMKEHQAYQDWLY